MKKLLSLIVTLNIVLLAGAVEAKSAGSTDPIIPEFSIPEVNEMNDEACGVANIVFEPGVDVDACIAARKDCSSRAFECFKESCSEFHGINSEGKPHFECTAEQVKSCQDQAYREVFDTWSGVVSPCESKEEKIKVITGIPLEAEEEETGWKPLPPGHSLFQTLPEDNNLDSLDNIDTEAPAQAQTGQGVGVVALSGSGKAGCSLQALGQAGNGVGLLQVFALFGLPLLIQKIRRKN